MVKKERKLSKQELERKEKFEKYTSERESNGYIKKDLIISVVKANFMGIVLVLPIMFLIEIVYYNINTSSLFDSNSFEPADVGYFWMLFLGTYLILIVVHELIHGITWAKFAKNGFKSISFGIIWKYFTPYCTCNSSMRKKEYIAGSIMPTLILGIIPAIVAIYIGNEFLLYVAQAMIISGGGDMCIIFDILRYKSSAKEIEYMDHPYEVGLVVFEK